MRKDSEKPVKVERKHFSREEKTEILKITNRKCAHCGISLDEDTMTVEHVFPLNKGGDNSKYNIVALCPKCNNAKSNFIYDMSYYVYIGREYIAGFYNALKDHVFIKGDSPKIFGNCNLSSYVVLESYMNLIMNSKRLRKKSKDLLHKFSTTVELRPLFPGDLTDDVLELIMGGMHSLVFKVTGIEDDTYDDEHDPDFDDLTINKYMIYNLYDNGKLGMYGLYYKGDLVGVKMYMNLKDLVLDNPDFLNEVAKLSFDHVFVEVMSLIAVKYKEIADCVYNFENDFMIHTNSIILDTSHERNGMVKDTVRGYPATGYELEKDNTMFSSNIGVRTNQSVRNQFVYYSSIKLFDSVYEATLEGIEERKKRLRELKIIE